MGRDTAIAWTNVCDGLGATFNPWIGCSRIHTGCLNCYAENEWGMDRRGRVIWGPNGTRSLTTIENWANVLKWNRECEKTKTVGGVFCASLADILEDFTGTMMNHRKETVFICNRHGFDRNPQGLPIWDTDEYCPHCERESAPSKLKRAVVMSDVRREVFALMDRCPWLIFICLTKRPGNIITHVPRAKWCPKCGFHGFGNVNCPTCVSVNDHILPTGDVAELRKSHHPIERSAKYRANVWWGTSVSDQKTYDEFAHQLFPARNMTPVLFLSGEPLVDRMSLRNRIWCRYHERFEEAVMDESSPCFRWQSLETDMIDQLIIGGESGEPKDYDQIREFDVAWACWLLAQCEYAGIKPFMKQFGSRPINAAGTEGANPTRIPMKLNAPKGDDLSEWPFKFRVQEFPQAAAQYQDAMRGDMLF